jgi:hypothetical protein
MRHPRRCNGTDGKEEEEYILELSYIQCSKLKFGNAKEGYAIRKMKKWIYKKKFRYRRAGAKGEMRYISCSFLTSALDRGEWPASRPGRALAPGIGLPVPTRQEADWAPELVWTRWLEEKFFASAGDRTPVIQSVARLYTH